MVQFGNKTEEGRERAPELERIKREVLREWFPEGKEGVEKKELTEKEREEREKLKEEIEKAKLSYKKKLEAQKEADTLREKTALDKISHLLDLAQSKGVTYAVKVARETKDALVIDVFHDILAKNGQYKKFPK